MEQPSPLVPGPSKEELGKCLRSLRLALGLTMEQLADRSGLLVALLDDVEQGRDTLEREVLVAIAQGLGMTPGTIIRLCERHVVFRVNDQQA